MTLQDPRFVCLQGWLQQQLPAGFSVSQVSGDASFRRYFRVQTAGTSLIAVDSPPQLVPIAPFLALDKAFADAGLAVPAVIAANETDGLMLLEDLGDVQLGSLLCADNVLHWYCRALKLLPRVFAIRSCELGPLVDYDAAFVQRELAIFSEWLLGAHLKLEDIPKAMLERSFALLTESAMAQPKGGMHRDFHSRNIIVRGDELVLIDFQDAVLGPVTYDAVSLLRDCYARWDDSLVNALRDEYFELLGQQGLLSLDISAGQFQRWFDLMGLQRHIKAAGIFARLYHQDGKSGYLKDIPLTLSYIVDIARRYPEFEALGDWVAGIVQPAVDKWWG
ncbi:MAG: phosphotransferase [Shewanella sp.]|nr:phosphotransferase [Shewanella sp.]MCF1430723.1 phosphotransferase [Shewanella sp.]MCF1437904.1 phosphotransferase [Shewanella sp.]MCF1458514.1 phosphotransferase [Shewanella sp.]